MSTLLQLSKLPPVNWGRRIYDSDEHVDRFHKTISGAKNNVSPANDIYLSEQDANLNNGIIYKLPEDKTFHEIMSIPKEADNAFIFYVYVLACCAESNNIVLIPADNNWKDKCGAYFNKITYDIYKASYGAIDLVGDWFRIATRIKYLAIQPVKNTTPTKGGAEVPLHIRILSYNENDRW